MEKIIDIKGMHCKSCVEIIESRIRSLKGIENIRVSLIENKAFVRFDPKEINLDNIRSEIEKAGYKCECNDLNTNNTPENLNTNNAPEDFETTQNKKGDDYLAINLNKFFFWKRKNNEKNIEEKNERKILQGLAYGLIPHIGCIAFIIGSIFGVTFLMQFFKPLLMNPYFFHILVLISIGFATISSAFYLRKNGLLSLAGTKRKWKYLSTMYGSTIGINLLLFLVIFPLLANVSTAQSVTGNFISANNVNSLSLIKLGVDIPCSGHAPLISDELKKIDGVSSVQFSLPNVFDVKYDSSKTTKQQILSLEVFKTYKATVLSEALSQNTGKSNGNLAVIKDSIQIVKLSVQGANYYPNPIRVKKGIPVQLVADMNSVQGCSRSIIIPEFGVRKTVSASDNVIEFTPDKSGTFKFSCSMGMYLGQIVVEEADGSVSAYTGSAPVPSGGSCGGGSGGCGCGGR